MTANDIFDMTLALMFSTTQADRDEYNEYFIPVLNVLLNENFKLNNQLRLQAGKEALEDVPTITALADTVDYEDALTRSILPYGCAGYIYADDDGALSVKYKNKYEYERGIVLGTEYMGIEDIWDVDGN